MAKKSVRVDAFEAAVLAAVKGVSQEQRENCLRVPETFAGLIQKACQRIGVGKFQSVEVTKTSVDTFIQQETVGHDCQVLLRQLTPRQIGTRNSRVTFVTPGKIGFTKKPTFTDLVARAGEFGLKLCPYSVILNLRMSYSLEHCVFATKPIGDRKMRSLVAANARETHMNNYGGGYPYWSYDSIPLTDQTFPLGTHFVFAKK